MTVWRAVRISVVIVFIMIPLRSLGSKFIFPEKSRGQVQGGILSGWPAESGQIPFQLALRVVDRTGSVVSCAGSIIHAEYGLTAAHCIVGRHTIMIRAGCSNMTRSALMFDTTIFSIHPLFDETNPDVVQPHDIGLISFGRIIEFGSLIQPVRLQRVADMNKNYDGQRMIASGWSILHAGDQVTEPVSWVYLRGISNQECVDVYGKDHVLEDSTICARWYNYTSNNNCVGESGGPLTIYDDDGTLTQVGIASFVFHIGCHTGLPAGFVRPGHYHDWLTAVTGYNFNWNNEERTTSLKPLKPYMTALPRYYPRTEAYIFPSVKNALKIKTLKINKLPGYEPAVGSETHKIIQQSKEKIDRVSENKNKNHFLDLDEEQPGIDLDAILSSFSLETTTTTEKSDVYEMDPFVPEENKYPELETAKLEKRLNNFKKLQKQLKKNKNANSSLTNMKKRIKQRKNETVKLEEEEHEPGDFRMRIGDLVQGKIEPEDLKVQLQKIVKAKTKLEDTKKKEFDYLLKEEIKKENSHIEIDSLARGKIDPEDLTINIGDLMEKFDKIKYATTKFEFSDSETPKTEKTKLDYNEKDLEYLQNNNEENNGKEVTEKAEVRDEQNNLELEKAEPEYLDAESENSNVQLRKENIGENNINPETLQKLESDDVEPEKPELERSEQTESGQPNLVYLEKIEGDNGNSEHAEKNEADDGTQKHLESNETENDNSEKLEKTEPDHGNPEHLEKNEPENNNSENLEKAETEKGDSEYLEKNEPDNGTIEHSEKIDGDQNDHELGKIELDKAYPENLENIESDKNKLEPSEKLVSDKPNPNYLVKLEADSEYLDQVDLEKIESDKTEPQVLQSRSLDKTTLAKTEYKRLSEKIESEKAEPKLLQENTESDHLESDNVETKLNSKTVETKKEEHPKIQRGEFKEQENTESDQLESDNVETKKKEHPKIQRGEFENALSDNAYSENLDDRERSEVEREDSLLIDNIESALKDDIKLKNSRFRGVAKQEDEKFDGEDEKILDKIMHRLNLH